MYVEGISAEVQASLELVGQTPLAAQFYLAGGTAVALCTSRTLRLTRCRICSSRSPGPTCDGSSSRRFRICSDDCESCKWCRRPALAPPA